MQKLKYLFTVPEGEKVTEKHLYRVLISSVCCIVLCMVCLVSTTWAWYTTTIVSEGNVIEIGDFRISVTIEPNAATAATNNSSFVFDTTGEYQVTITNVGSTNGYCTVTFREESSFDTVTIGPGNSVNYNLIVKDTAVGLSMDITNHWGNSSVQNMPDQPFAFGSDEPEPPVQESTGTDQEPGEDETPSDESTASQPENDTQEPETTEPDTTVTPETTTAPSENSQVDGNG